MRNMIFIQKLASPSVASKWSKVPSTNFEEHHAMLFVKRDSLKASLYGSAKGTETENGRYFVDTIGVLRKFDYMSSTEAE
jgi:hypothetical protein